MKRNSALIISQSLLLLPLFVCGLVLAQDDAATPPNEFDRIRAQYQKLTTELVDGRQAERQALQQAYVSNLEDARKFYMQQGNLVNTLAAKQELDRFTLDKKPLATPPAALDEKLKNLLKSFDYKWREITLTNARKRIILNEAYITHLEKLEQELTRAGQLEQALAVFNERQDISKQTAQLRQELPAAPPEPDPTTPLHEAGVSNALNRIPTELRKDLVAFYTFDAPGITVKDESGNGNDAEASKVNWTADGKVGAAVEFGGRKQLVTLGRGKLAAALNGATAVSFAMWIRPDELSGKSAPEAPIVFAQKNQREKSAMALIVSRSGTVFGGSALDDGAWASVSGSALTVGRWQHMAGTVDYANNSFTLFLNGEKVAGRGFSDKISAYKNFGRQKYDDSLGGATNDRSRNFEGALDEVMFFRTGLSAAQVKALAGL